MDDATFRKRPGTTSRGKEFEDLIVANLILKLLQDNNFKNFQLSSNDDNYGAFDDIVLETETHQDFQEIHALQLKHVNKERALTKNALKDHRGNFSILKYFEDFCKLQKSHTQIKFVLFTNLKFEVAEGETLHLDDDSEATVVKSEVNALLNTSLEGRCYRFGCKNEKYAEFFRKFYLYTNQANVQKMKMRVAYGFENLFSCGGFALKEYLDFVGNWSIKEGKKSRLHSVMMKRVLALCVLSHQIVPFCFDDASVSTKSEMLKEALCHFRVTAFDMDNQERITKVYSGVQNDLGGTENVVRTGLKYQIISKREDLSSLNDVDKTKLLWLSGGYPLIVVEDYVVNKVINLCQEDKFVLLRNTNEGVNFRYLSDLRFASDIYGKILDNFTCSIQGKKDFTLRALLAISKEFETIITTDELLKMVEGTFVVGGLDEDLPAPYISRLISVNTVDYKFLDEIGDDTLVVISCGSQLEQIKEHLSQYHIRKMQRNDDKWVCSSEGDLWSERLSLSNTSTQTVFVNEDDCSTNLLKVLCKKNPLKKQYHHFKLVAGKLHWVESVGTTEDLEKYCSNDDFIPEADFSTTKENKTELICADPGMGKSVLMRSLKTQQPPNYWTVLISSKQHSSFFDNHTCNATTFIEHVLAKGNRFEAKFLRVLTNNRQVIFIWDGLDEISPKKLLMVVDVIVEISKKEFFQFVTSRYNLKKILENDLNVLARTIKPFDEKEQSLYIMDRLNLKEEDDIIKKITQSIKVVRCYDILGVPLHIYMLTELFLRDQEKYSRILNDDELFSIADLYYYFVDEKFNIYYNEKAKLDDTVDAVQEVISSGKRDRLNNYEIASLNLFFSNRKKLNNNFLEEIRKNNDSVGIIANVTSENVPIFIHHSFGDYFVASYLVKNHKQEKNIQGFLFTEKHKTIRFFFDLILAKDCPAHVAVLYQNSNLVMSYEEELYRTDKCGRSPFHLACSWGMRYYPFKFQKVGLFGIKYDNIQTVVKGEPTENRQILEFLTLHCIPYQIDNIFQMDAFAYANNSSSFYPMLLLIKTYKRRLTTFSSFSDVNSVLYHAVKLDYTEIFDIPDVNRVLKERVEWTVRTSLRWNSLRILEKLLFDKNYNKKIDTSNLPIHIACRYRNIQVLQLLIRTKIDLNAVDESEFTPLAVACKHGHLDTARLLVNHGAIVNCTNSKLLPLDAACAGAHVSTVKYLIESGADVHLLSKSGVTCLHHAAASGSVNIARMLIEKGLNVNITCRIQTSENVTPLFVACAHGCVNMVGFLLDNGADVNNVTDHGFTALVGVCEMGFRRIARMLIAAGVDVNATSILGVSALHRASWKGHVEVVQILLDAGADTNCETKDRRTTPLHLACKYGHTEIVKMLVRAGANINTRNMFGRNAIQFARSKGYSEIVQILSIANKLNDISTHVN